MNTNLLEEVALHESPASLGTVTRKMMRERAVELAVSSGRSALEASKADWEQAKRELARD